MCEELIALYVLFPSSWPKLCITYYVILWLFVTVKVLLTNCHRRH